MVMKQGLERAIQVTSASTLPNPAPLCGSKFQYKGALLNCDLVGTPIPQPRSKMVYEPRRFCMGQGEMFECDLHAHQAKNAVGSEPGSMIDDAPSTGGKALLKVTCVSVHEYLHLPSVSDKALLSLKNKDSRILDNALIEHRLYENQETLAIPDVKCLRRY